MKDEGIATDEHAWHERLRERDRVVGLEAAVETARQRDRRRVAKIRDLQAQVDRLTKRLERARREQDGHATPAVRRLAGKVRRTFRR